jgi:NAD(P)-dependent dehydrogenase (short-subunit alcohol dehydrogenase family)
MELKDQGALVTGGASGLGLATARRLARAGAHVVVADLPKSPGSRVTAELGERARFVTADVTDTEQLRAAVAEVTRLAPLRAVVHTAGRGGSVRLVGKDGTPGDAARFAEIVHTNLVGSYHVASIAAAAMAANEPSEGDRGAIVLTASVAAFEGQIGQAGYAASKAGVVGLTLCGARDLAAHNIRICTIAPGIMDTPMLGKLRADIKESLARSVPHPRRLGQPEEFASLAQLVLENGYLNGETFRLDGAIRMAPR